MNCLLARRLVERGVRFIDLYHEAWDHHSDVAGGGIRGGQTIGETDDLGFHITRDRVHVHDLQATILYLLGLEHTKLTYKCKGRDFRLTDVAGEVVGKLLA